MPDKKQWYNNQQIYEMVREMKEGIGDTMNRLTLEMAQTRHELSKTQEGLVSIEKSLKRYNGLHEKLATCEKKIARIEVENEAKDGTWDNIRKWIPVFTTIIVTLIAVYAAIN